MKTDLLFVYGTLNPTNNLLEDMNIKYNFISKAKVIGAKIENTIYPSVIPPTENETEFVEGILLQLKDAKSALVKLDKYEEYYPKDEKKSLYLRRITNVYIADKIVKAYIYWFKLSDSNLSKNTVSF